MKFDVFYELHVNLRISLEKIKFDVVKSYLSFIVLCLKILMVLSGRWHSVVGL